jgi:nucleotide-binding universal stress UspA family protein
MQLLQRILVATDLSQAADDAVKMAAYLAKAFQSEIILQYVMPPLPDVSEPSDMVKGQIKTYLEAIRQRLVDDGISVGEPVFSTGEPFVKIIDCAEQRDVNVIVIGSGEKDESDQYRMGITADRLERGAERPVLVVKRGAAPPVGRILCPVDGSETSGRALGEAIHLARALKSPLTVLTVVQPLRSLIPPVIAVSEESRQAHREAQTAEFETFVDTFDYHGVDHERIIRDGQPHEEILKSVKQRDAQLLVMGSVGRTGMARVLLGSVAEKVARQLPCSIMTVKGEDFVRLRLHDEIKDLHDHVHRAEELLEKGFAREALGELRRCIARDPIYAPAWEGAAVAYQRLGNEEKAQQCQQRAKEIVQTLWDRRVEAEIRSERLRWRQKGPLST